MNQEPRQCCFVTNSGTRCKVTRNLNRILILDPEKAGLEKWGCYEHCKNYVNQRTDDIRFKLEQIKFLNHQIEESKKLDKLHQIMQEGSGYKIENLKQRDDKRIILKKKLDEELKELRQHTCRNLLCRKSISPNEFKCAIEIRSHYNTPRENLYYHRQCIINEKGALGFVLPIHTGQFTLETMLNQ